MATIEHGRRARASGVASYPATYEDAFGPWDTVIHHTSDLSIPRPNVGWRVTIRGIVFAGPLESLQACVVPDAEFDARASAASGSETLSWGDAPAVLRRVGDRYEAATDRGVQAGAVALDDAGPAAECPPGGWPPIPTRRFGGRASSLFFGLHQGTLTFDMAVDVDRDGGREEAQLRVAVDLAGEQARLALRVDDQASHARPASHLEFALPDAEQGLDRPAKVVCCFNCAMADYSHAGTALSGMMCFRDDRGAYAGVREKQDFMRLVPDAVTEYVDELYLCPEFEHRRPGTGYRG